MLRTATGSGGRSLLPVVGGERRGSDDEAQAVAALEVDRANEAYLWLLLLAAAAECSTTCFLPEVATSTLRLNASATALNFIGPFLDGLTYGYEDLPKTGLPSPACLQFRSAFLGVFTSFSFMADHAGDLSAHSALMGVLYIAGSVLGGCVCFLIGRAIVRPVMAVPPVANFLHAVSSAKKPSLMTAVVWLVALCIVRAVFGPSGFVRDPKDPQFVGPLQVADGEELMLGIFMSCSAILLSDYINTSLQSFGRTWAWSRLNNFDWGCVACNFLACAFVWLAYGASRLSSRALTNNLLILKFVSSFCGSLSCFSAAVSHISRLYGALEHRAAACNLALHVGVALAFIPLLLK